MLTLICKILPVLAFLTGTLLGGLIIYLFNRERRRDMDERFKNVSNTNIALESQLQSKSRLEDDLSKTNSEIEKLRDQVQFATEKASAGSKKLKAKNKSLQKELVHLRTGLSSDSKSNVDDYRRFLLELEQNIKRAKKRSFSDTVTRKARKPKKSSAGKKIDKKKVPPGKKKKKEKPLKLKPVNSGVAKKNTKKKKKSTKKDNGKYDFYKAKFANKSFAPDNLFKPLEEEKNLTYLFGISDDIQDLLRKNGIEDFSDLSLTKIAELKAILSTDPERRFENVDPLNWPIQARIAEKGQWEILDEYKAKMNNVS